MITNNMLSDLHGIFVAMRFDCSHFTPESIHALIEGLNPDRKVEDENLIRQILRSFQLSSIPALHFITTDNEYVFIRCFRNKQLDIIIRDILFTISVLIRKGNKKQLYDFLDAIHNYPIIIHTQIVRSPQKLAKKLLKTYRKKWNSQLFHYTSEND